MSTSSKPRILVVGAGPSGLVMALSLLRNGVSVRLIDKEPTSRMGQRGAGIMPRSLELFHALGVSDAILRRAIPPPQAVVYAMPAGVKPLAKFDMWPPSPSTSQRPFPNVVMLGQDHLEGILRTELQRLGCETEWGASLLSFEQRDGEDVVRTRISRPHHDGNEELIETPTFDFVVGCDGARGMVRKSLGLSFLGETNNADNLVIGDVMVVGLDEKLWHMWGEVGIAWLSLRPTEVPFMFNFLLSGVDVDHKHIVNHPELLAPLFAQYTGGRKDIFFGDVVWLSHYRPNIRMVDKFRVGRVFVAGDAAHVHSITGGQGMNTGVQDCLNLGWKLALVQRNLAPASLLDTYTEERAPVVAAMLNRISALLKETTINKNSPKLTVPTHGGRAAWKHNGGGILQLGVNCRWSSIVVDEQPEADDLDPELDGLYEEDEEEDTDEDVEEDRYLTAPLCAGDRAPDAPGLVAVRHRAADSLSKTTSLFGTFSASRHTVLVFSNHADRWGPVAQSLKSYPHDTVQCAVVVPGDTAANAYPGVDLVLADAHGEAYRTYALTGGCDIVVVRPDGLIGAIVREGLIAYLDGIFKRPFT
ncbi:FAD binding domain-containing protein [Roridomyces roridus]|uniref:FAD binding domain-containing protein n=1 Tax=Roridomyces roridus TaxID=1738132 RepID=A0AAD7BK10_9AGAR|nr:FAD binding domain-containing protein [Roridomyces roridus]